MDCLEIIQPKPGDTRHFPQQLEHAEFVLQVNSSLHEFVEQYPDLPFDSSDIDRPDNPEVRLPLASGHTVGIHTVSLVEWVS